MSVEAHIPPITEMLYQIRAELFGPLAEIVFHHARDDRYGTGMSSPAQYVARWLRIG